MPRKAATNKSFEEQIGMLETLISQLESGELSLEESIKAYKQGMDLAVHCSQVLETAKQEVYLYEKGNFNKFNGDKEEE